MLGHTKPLRTLHINDHGSKYTITDTDDVTLLYTVHWTPNSTPHMTVYRDENQNDAAGTAVWLETKKLGFHTPSQITLTLPSGVTSLNKEGSVFSTDKRTFRSPVLGQVYWKGGYAAGGFFKLVDGKGKSFVEYKAMREGGRIGTMEIKTEVQQEGLDEVIVSGMAMLSEALTSMANTAGAISRG